MSNLEQHITSLEISKRLKEVGFEINCIYSYRLNFDGDAFQLVRDTAARLTERYPAYHAEQLLELLPLDLKLNKWVELKIVRLIDGWQISYGGRFSYSPPTRWINTSLANAAAEALLWCIKEGYINSVDKQDE